MFDCIDRFLGFTCTLNEWRFHLKDHYDTLRPFLLSTGRQSANWCCPVNGRKQPLCPPKSRVDSGQLDWMFQPCVDVRDIPPTDLELWRFSASVFAKTLCTTLGLQSAPKKIGSSVLRLGYIIHQTSRLPAFLLKKSSTNYQDHADDIVARYAEYCLFYTPRYCAETAEWLSLKNHGYFPLDNLLLPGSFSPSPAYWKAMLDYKAALSSGSYRPDPEIIIESDFKRIRFPDGYVLNLATAFRRRAVVRFIHEQVSQSGNNEFDVEIMREAYNKQYPDKPWNSDRIKEDLFKRNQSDFDRIFETIDAAIGRYRLKI